MLAPKSRAKNDTGLLAPISCAENDAKSVTSGNSPSKIRRLENFDQNVGDSGIGKDESRTVNQRHLSPSNATNTTTSTTTATTTNTTTTTSATTTTTTAATTTATTTATTSTTTIGYQHNC